MTLLLREYLIQQFFCKICCWVYKSFVLLQTKKEKYNLEHLNAYTYGLK